MTNQCQWNDVNHLPPKDVYVNVLIQLIFGGMLSKYYTIERAFWQSTRTQPVYWNIQNNGIVVAWSPILEVPEYAKGKILTNSTIGVK